MSKIPNNDLITSIFLFTEGLKEDDIVLFAYNGYYGIVNNTMKVVYDNYNFKYPEIDKKLSNTLGYSILPYSFTGDLDNMMRQYQTSIHGRSFKRVCYENIPRQLIPYLKLCLR